METTFVSTWSVLMFVGFVAALTYLSALIYRRVWPLLDREQATPTGFGVLLPLAMLAATAVFPSQSTSIGAFAAILVASAVYWLDDFMGLSVLLRLGLS